MLAAANQSRAAARRQQQLLLLQQEEENLQLLQQEQEQEFQRQQLLQYQKEQQHQLQIQRALQQQHHREHHHQTPPPRMLPGASQSPRFHEHQRQILLLQQQQELQQQQRLLELQEQLRLEELERQIERQQVAQMHLQKNHSPNHISHRGQPPGPTMTELQLAHTLHQRSESPAARRSPFSLPLQENMQYVSQNTQLQQRLLSEMAQVEFMRDMQGTSTQAEQESLRMEAMKKIVEAEKMEEKRRRKAMKIAHMVRIILVHFTVLNIKFPPRLVIMTL